MRSNFVNKVYDTYISEDFDYGTDNLNPVREIDLSNTKSIDDQIAAVYAELNKRVEKVKKTVSDITGSTENQVFKGNSVSEGNNDSSNGNLSKVIDMTGGSGEKIVVIPFFNNDMDPVTLELELMLLEKTLQAYYPDDDSDGDGGGGTPPGMSVIDIPPFGPDCSFIMANANNGQANKDLSDSLSDMGDLGGDENVSRPTSGDTSSSGASNPDAITVDASKLADAVADALSAADKATEKSEKDAADCAKAELGILKMILAILKVIKMIRQIMDPAFTLIMQAIKLVQLAAQCWNNPTCIGVIIQRVLGTVIAILMGVVAELMAQIWKMLGLDCFCAEAQAIMDQIREALAAIGGIISTLDPTGIIMDIKEMVGSVEDTFDDVSNNIKNFNENIKNIGDTAKKALKAQLEMYFPGITEEEMASFLSNPRYRQKMLDTLKSVAPPEAVKNITTAVDKALSVPDDISKVYKQIQDLTKTLSPEKQLMSTMEDLQSF